MQKGENDAIFKMVTLNPSPGLGKNDGKMISTWNLGYSNFEGMISF
jgi:hypothetical protein